MAQLPDANDESLSLLLDLPPFAREPFADDQRLQQVAATAPAVQALRLLRERGRPGGELGPWSGTAPFPPFSAADAPEPDAEPDDEDVEPETVGASTPEGVGYSPARPTRGAESAMYPGGAAFVRGMMRRGWSPEEAAAVAGNVHVESGFRPAVKSSAPGEQSYGFLQWNKERLQGLKNYADARGKDWRDPDTQMDWIHLERTGESVRYGGADERHAYAQALAGGGSASEIAERFGRYVERPKDLSQSVRQRMSAADRYASLVGRRG